MAKLIRIEPQLRRTDYIFACSGCGKEVTLSRNIRDRNTFCCGCMKKNKQTSIEKHYREKERGEIVAMIEEIKSCGSGCTADLILERIKSRDGYS